MDILIVSKSISKTNGGVERVNSALLHHFARSQVVSRVKHCSSFRCLIKSALLDCISFSISTNSPRKLIIASGFSSFAFLIFPFRQKIFLLHGFYDPLTIDNANFRLKTRAWIYTYLLLPFISVLDCELVAPSFHSALVNSLYTRKSAINVIPWGGFPDSLEVQPKPFNCRDIDILYHGRITPEKLNMTALATCALELSNITTPSRLVKIVLSGSFGSLNEFHFRGTLDDLLGESNYALDIHDNPSDPEYIELMCNSKYFFNGHPWEAFGLSLLEALQSGSILLVPATTPLISHIQKASFIRYLPQYSPTISILDAEFLKENYDSVAMASYYRNTFTWKHAVDLFLDSTRTSK